jgi:hypothetical protein
VLIEGAATPGGASFFAEATNEAGETQGNFGAGNTNGDDAGGLFVRNTTFGVGAGQQCGMHYANTLTAKHGQPRYNPSYKILIRSDDVDRVNKGYFIGLAGPTMPFPGMLVPEWPVADPFMGVRFWKGVSGDQWMIYVKAAGAPVGTVLGLGVVVAPNTRYYITMRSEIATGRFYASINGAPELFVAAGLPAAAGGLPDKVNMGIQFAGALSLMTISFYSVRYAENQQA